MQDLLKSYPVPVTPETWPLNDLFLKAVGRRIGQFQKNGRFWMFAIEMEFAPLSPAHFEDRAGIKKFGEDRVLRACPHIAPSLELFHKLEKQPDDGFVKHACDRMVDYVKTNAETLADYLKATGKTQAEVIQTLKAYKNALDSHNKLEAYRARQDIFLAWLHIMPRRQGGLREVLEPRFGNLTYGRGWWDSPGTAEIRLAPITSPSRFIREYHGMIQAVYKTCERFHLIPEMHLASPQLHFSIWEDYNAEGKYYNTMEMLNDMDVVCNQYNMYGIYGMIGNAPHLINDFDPTNLDFHVDLDIGHHKGHTIRQNGRSWEIRRKSRSNFIHLARDLAVIVGGVYHQSLGKGMSSIHECEKRYPKMIKESRIMAVEDIYGSLHKSPFFHIVSSCELTADNELVMTFDSVVQHMDPCIKELGGHEKASIYKFKSQTSEEWFGLDTIAGWALLLRLIKVQPDGRLDTSKIPDDLRPYFDRLKIVGNRWNLSGHTVSTLYGAGPLLQSLEAMKKCEPLNGFFSPEEIDEIAAFYESRIPARMQTLSEILLDSVLAIPPSDDQVVTKDYIKKIFDKVVKSLVTEDSNADSVPASFCTRPKPSSIEEMQATRTSLSLLQAAFKQAAEDRQRKLRAEGRLGNHNMSLIADAQDYIEKSAFDLTAYHKTEIPELVAFYARSEHFWKKNGNILRVPYYAYILGSLERMAFMALSTPAYSKADVIKMLEECREQAKEHLAELSKGLPEKTKQALKKVRKSEITKMAHRHHGYSKFILRQLLAKERGYDQLIKKVRDFPDHAPRHPSPM